MDDTVNACRRRLLCACGAAMAMGAAAAQGQVLNDPTRPPANLMAPQTAAAPSVGPQLQSVLIARHPGGRHIAVIDGHTLRLGDKYKGAVLERVADNEVVLVRGTQRQVLRLYAPAPKQGSNPKPD